MLKNSLEKNLRARKIYDPNSPSWNNSIWNTKLSPNSWKTQNPKNPKSILKKRKYLQILQKFKTRENPNVYFSSAVSCSRVRHHTYSDRTDACARHLNFNILASTYMSIGKSLLCWSFYFVLVCTLYSPQKINGRPICSCWSFWRHSCWSFLEDTM